MLSLKQSSINKKCNSKVENTIEDFEDKDDMNMLKTNQGGPMSIQDYNIEYKPRKDLQTTIVSHNPKPGMDIVPSYKNKQIPDWAADSAYIFTKIEE